MCPNKKLLLLKRQMVFSDKLGGVLQAENEMKYNYSLPNNVATELYPVSNTCTKAEKKLESGSSN